MLPKHWINKCLCSQCHEGFCTGAGRWSITQYLVVPTIGGRRRQQWDVHPRNQKWRIWDFPTYNGKSLLCSEQRWKKKKNQIQETKTWLETNQVYLKSIEKKLLVGKKVGCSYIGSLRKSQSNHSYKHCLEFNLIPPKVTTFPILCAGLSLWQKHVTSLRTSH